MGRDLVGQQIGQPVYALAAAITGQPIPQPYPVRCYDTSLYFDDLHLSSEREAAARLDGEARTGYVRGHRAFKIKIGRGARHLPVEEGTRRDIAVMLAVRAAVGSACALLADANNGYTLKLAKRVLEATAACDLRWLEEPFHEDDVLYRDLRDWLMQRGLRVLIADGEGDASPRLLAWARGGVVDVVQYDILVGHGLTRWLATGRWLDAWGAQRAAPPRDVLRQLRGLPPGGACWLCLCRMGRGRDARPGRAGVRHRRRPRDGPRHTGLRAGAG